MKNIKSKHKISLVERENLVGYIFIIPLVIGLVMFFVIPVFKSLLFSISDISLGRTGYAIGKFAGLKYFKEALFNHTSYRQTVVETFLNVILKVPLVMVFSFFMAAVLNNKFKGQTFFKIVVFIPVVASLAMATTTLETGMDGFSGYKETFAETSVSFTAQIADYLKSVGIGEEVANSVTGIADSVYDVINESGIQILIMIVGMCSISPTLYEAAKVEGATVWECFWKITFPMTGPIIYTCLIYTIIDSFTDDTNGIMKLISSTSIDKQNFSLASSMGWIYFLIIAVILGVISFIMSKVMFYYDK